MSLTYFSTKWAAIAPALGNHLWQSTLFVIVAGLLTLSLRKNHARARYWLWMAASVKFLVPFSLLIAVGSYLPWSRGPEGTNAGVYVAMEEVSQPFTQTTPPAISRVAPATVSSTLSRLLPGLLAAAWFCGFVAVLFVWYARWWRVSAILRDAAPLREGREVEALRRLESVGGIRRRIEMLLSRASLEPGVFGIVRPVLVWPEGISGRLEDAHLEAILAHEVWHVRRRDNLAAAIHMVIEAIFWFHPLVWWLGARLVHERERACDEEVLALGSDRQVYAEGILKVCEFCVGSPLACVSGVTGADLEKRIVRIMNERISRKLNFSKKLLLSAAGVLALAAPVVLGLLHATQSRAESPAQNMAPSTSGAGHHYASVIPGAPGNGPVERSRRFGPDTFRAKNLTLQQLMAEAFGVKDNQISGGPEWVGSARFNVEAKLDSAAAAELRKTSPEQQKLGRQQMLQTVLADHFKLAFHRESKELPAYALVIAKNGPKVQAAKPGDKYPNGIEGRNGLPAGPHEMDMRPSKLTVQAMPMSEVAELLSMHLDRAVFDRTGLTGKYDLTVRWTPAQKSTGPSLFTAIEEQLGLRLEPQTVPMPVLVIDRAEKPSESPARNTATIPPRFESVLIKPNTTGEAMPPFKIVGHPVLGFRFKPWFLATNATLHQLTRVLYGVQDDQVARGPSWLDSEHYDVEVKMDKSVMDELEKLGQDQQILEQKRMLQGFLADRFKLSLHRETQDLPVYVLALAQNGPKLHEAKPGDTYPNGPKRHDNGLPQGMGLYAAGEGQLVGQGVPIDFLMGWLSGAVGDRIVVDKTGLTGKYDFTLRWAPSPESSGPSKLAAIQEQLGLKLEPQIVPMEVLVIDHAEKPSKN